MRIDKDALDLVERLTIALWKAEESENLRDMQHRNLVNEALEVISKNNGFPDDSISHVMRKQFLKDMEYLKRRHK
jgi:hypothetical protein